MVKMNLYRVFNGYIGFVSVNVLIVAANEERALELAREKFKEQSSSYGENYYSNLEAKLLGSAEKELICDIEE